jgi:hypothetical protein
VRTERCCCCGACERQQARCCRHPSFSRSLPLLFTCTAVCCLLLQGCTLNEADHCGDPPLILAAGGGRGRCAPAAALPFACLHSLHAALTTVLTVLCLTPLCRPPDVCEAVAG